MTMKEAMRARHTVRKFKEQPIAQDLIDLINARVAQNNEKYGLNIQLVNGNGDAVNGLARTLISKGINHYFILAGPDTPDLDEKLGYCGSDLILYAQTLGLNTWWIGGMVSKSGVKKNLSTDARVNGVIVVGYGEVQGSAHKSKTFDAVASYEGEMPQWFADGVEALLLAPTAINRQAFTVRGKGNQVSISYAKGPLSDIDLGIGKHHFELGAGAENFEWKQ